MPYATPGATNFFPILDQQLRVMYARNPRDFALPRYVLMADAPKQLSYYQTIDHAKAIRIPGSNQYSSYWADGANRPSGIMNSVEGNVSPIRLYRHLHNFQHGAMAVGQADYDVMKLNSYLMAQKAMTMRTLWVRNVLTASSIPSVTAATANGSFTAIGSGTVTNPVMLRILNYCGQKILKATGGVVKGIHLRAVFGPTVAAALATSAELLNFIAQSSSAMENLISGFNRVHNIPETYRGYPLVVEDSVIEDGNIGSASDPDFIWNSDDMFVLARIDKEGGTGLEGPGFSGEDGNIFPTQFSTCTLFEGPYYSVKGGRDGSYGMAVESIVDEINERREGGVRDNFGSEVTSIYSGMRVTGLITNV